MMCPYFSWRYVHAKHHQFTNSAHRDTTHVPKTLSELGLSAHTKNQSPSLFSLSSFLCTFGNYSPLSTLNMLLNLLIGFPLYLFGAVHVSRSNYDGSPSCDGKFSILNPNSAIFPPKLRLKVAGSTITFFVTLGLLIKTSMDYSALSIALWYVFPLIWGYSWYFVYTYLHHTDPSVPVYGEDEWTWMKGALTTIDRDYGVFNFFHHQIGSKHLCHHLFHEIPFYNSVKATKAMRDFLEPKGLYNFDPTPWWKALWRTFRNCQYVDDTCGTQYKKSFDDIVPLLRAKHE